MVDSNLKCNTQKSKAVYYKLDITKLNWNDTFLNTNHDGGKLTSEQSSKEPLRNLRLLHYILIKTK